MFKISFIRVLFYLQFMILFPSAVFAQACTPWPSASEIPKEWQNPQGNSKDLLLSLSSGISFAFVEVPINSTSLYGEGTYRMGSAKERLFETKLDVRISSPITGADGRRVLYMGKYEITKAQYIYVLGAGDPIKGLEVLAGKTGDKRVKSITAPVLNSSHECHQKLNREVRQLLSEPVTYLNYLDYIEFVAQLNGLCIATEDCAEQLRSFTKNREVAAFFRLPSEHEWEYVARRGGAYANDKINEAELQQDVPVLPDAGSVGDYAHINGVPNRPIPIGSRKPIDGLYDILGNAQEIMHNAFTSETGYGAVGGYVARGGHYKVKSSSLRVSSRAELLPFRVDDDTGEIKRQKFPFSGLRLALSIPVIGSANRLGSQQLYDEFTNEYTAFESTNDRGGNTFAEAEHLGALRGSDIKVSSELNTNDSFDFFSVDLAIYSALTFTSGKESSQFEVTVFHETGEIINVLYFRADTTRRISTKQLLPGKYVIKVSLPDQEVKGQYSLSINRNPADDTGFAAASSKLFNDKASIIGVHVNAKRKGASGYIGIGDISDVYPLINDADSDAIAIKLTAAISPIKIRILSENQDVLVEKILRQDDEVKAPIGRSSKGFIQITGADENTATTYSFVVKTASVVPQRFYKHFQLAKNGQAISQNDEYQGWIGGHNLEWHFKFVVQEFQNVNLTLSGLSADVDMRVRNKDNQTISRSGRKSGTQDEVFQEDLEAGIYFVRLALKERKKITPFSVNFSLGAPTRAKIYSVAEAREKVKRLKYKSKEYEVFGVRYFKFNTSGKNAIYSFGLKQFSARADLNLYLENAAGNLIAKSENSGAVPELIETNLLQNTEYFLRIEAGGTETTSSFLLNVSAHEKLASTKAWEGRLISTHGDWEVRKNPEGRCTAVTEAEQYTPKKTNVWPGGDLPKLEVSYAQGSDSVRFFLFYVREEKANAVSASILLNGNWRNLNEVSYSGPFLVPYLRSAEISNKTIKAFKNGTKLIIKTNVNGKELEFTYSLKGYVAANRAANSHCGANASWTVK